MTAPALAAGRFAVACLLGLVLGIGYDLLHPVRRAAATLADLLFLPMLWLIWLYLGFGICRGDLRFGYTAGLGVGFLLWRKTASPFFRGITDRILGYFQKNSLFSEKEEKNYWHPEKKRLQ